MVNQNCEVVNVEVAYQNCSYSSGAVPVRALYGGTAYWDDEISFSGVPFEVVARNYTADAGNPGRKAVEAQINWDDRESEENADINSMTYYIDVE